MGYFPNMTASADHSRTIDSSSWTGCGPTWFGHRLRDWLEFDACALLWVTTKSPSPIPAQESGR